MASQLVLDHHLLDILNKGQPTQINFILKQTEIKYEQNEQENEIDPALLNYFQKLKQPMIEDIEVLKDFEISVQKEVSNVLQEKSDQQIQKILTLTFLKNEKISLEDPMTKIAVEIPVRCKECLNSLTSCLDIKSYATAYLIEKDSQQNQFECPLCHHEWDCDKLRLSEIIYVDYPLLEVMQLQDVSKEGESLDLEFDGKQLLLKQIKKKNNFSRKSFLKRLKQTCKSTITKITILPQLKLPLVRNNCPYQNVIDFDVFYDGLLEHSERNQFLNFEELYKNLFTQFLNQVKFHKAYQDIIKISNRIYLQEHIGLYDFRKKYLILKEENSAQVLMFKNGEIFVFNYKFDNEYEKIKLLLKNVQIKDIIIELFKNDGQIITQDIENCKDFKFYVCESIYLYFLKDKIVVKLNQFIEKQQSLEEQSQFKLSNYFREIQLIQESLKEDNIHCLLQHNQETDQLNFLLKLIEILIFEKFEKTGGNVQLHELIEESDCLSDEQFQIKYHVKVHQGFDSLLFFTTEEKLSDIAEIITRVSSRKNEKLKKRIIELENEMLQQEIELKIREKKESLFQCPSLVINYITEEKIKMIIIALESKIVDTFQAVQSIISDINRQIFILHCSITEKQLSKLSVKHQYEMQKIEKSRFCHVTFHEEKIKSQYSIEIKYMKKCLNFVNDSQVICESILIWKIPCILETDYECPKQKLDQQLSQIKYYFFYSQNEQSIAFDFKDWTNEYYDYEKAKQEVVEFIVDFFYKQDHFTQNVFFIENYHSDIEFSKFIVQTYFSNNLIFDCEPTPKHTIQIIEHQATKLLQKTKNANDQKELTIQSKSKENTKLAKIELEKCLGMTEITIKNPYLFNAENELFSTIISQYKKQTSNDQEITFKLYNSQLNVFSQETNCFINHQNQYPQFWARCNSNFIKKRLNPSDSEFRMVEQHFKRSDYGNILRIYRIQNKQLWENYIFDKNKLIQSYKNIGQSLTNLEKERYLWHGVRYSHPEIIYKGDREGFDETYADLQNNLWGAGIYFSEKASCSRGYSYILNGYQDNDLKGSRVFLYCLVSTGRLEKRASDKSIRRPKAGYDCVTDGDSIFVLYSMDVRRAYPAYEIIFT